MAIETLNPQPNEQDAATLRKDLDAVRSDLKTLMADIREISKERGERALQKGKDVASKAGDKIEATRETVEDKVRENPLVSVGIAFGVGVLLAGIARR